VSDQADDNSNGPQLVWVGTVEQDPFYDACKSRYRISVHESIYEALADFIVGRSAAAVIVNVRATDRALDQFWKHLCRVSDVRAGLIYSLPRGTAKPQTNPHGPIDIRWVDSPDELLAALAELSVGAEPEAEPPEESIQEPLPEHADRRKDKPVAKSDWPAQPPGETARIRLSCDQVPPADNGEQVSKREDVDAGRPEQQEKEFKPATLTQEELRALLGSESDQ